MWGSRRGSFARVLSVVSLVATLSCSSGSPSGPSASGTSPGVLIISTQTLPDGVLGVQYSGALRASGGSPNYAWTVENGSLPSGVTLSETGALSGTPASLQTVAFTARVRSTDGQTATKQLSLRVVESSSPPVAVATVLLPPALLDAPFEVTLRASGGSGTDFAWSVSAGSLPPGVSLAASGAFSGRPSRAGVYSFTVT